MNLLTYFQTLDRDVLVENEWKQAARESKTEISNQAFFPSNCSDDGYQTDCSISSPPKTDGGFFDMSSDQSIDQVLIPLLQCGFDQDYFDIELLGDELFTDAETPHRTPWKKPEEGLDTKTTQPPNNMGLKQSGSYLQNPHRNCFEFPNICSEYPASSSNTKFSNNESIDLSLPNGQGNQSFQPSKHGFNHKIQPTSLPYHTTYNQKNGNFAKCIQRLTTYFQQRHNGRQKQNKINFISSDNVDVPRDYRMHSPQEMEPISPLSPNLTQLSFEQSSIIQPILQNQQQDFQPSENSKSQPQVVIVKKEKNIDLNTDTSSCMSNHNSCSVSDSFVSPEISPCKSKEVKLIWDDFPYTAEELGSIDVSKFNEILKGLNEMRQHQARDIRRKFKNKIAARNCRKRKIQQIDHLGSGVETLDSKLKRLRKANKELKREITGINNKTKWLNSHLLQKLKNKHGKPYSKKLYSLAYASDGEVYLVPSGLQKQHPSADIPK